MAVRFRPSSPTILRLAADACVDPRTVILVLGGGGKPHTRDAVSAAARRLGIGPTDPIALALAPPMLAVAGPSAVRAD